MNFNDIFAEYYTAYRGDSEVPGRDDPEWAIAVRFANTALRRLENVDTELWEWLWTSTARESATISYTGSGTTAPVFSTYTCPPNMKLPGGWVNFSNSSGTSQFKLNVIPVHMVQKMSDASPYAYFTGNEQNGYTLNVNLLGNSYNGYLIDFPYYKKLTRFDGSSDGNGNVNEDGSTVTECPDTNFIINYILAYRFRSSRNYPSYQTAVKDAETSLQNMQQRNRMGIDGHTANMNDTNNTGTFGF